MVSIGRDVYINYYLATFILTANTRDVHHPLSPLLFSPGAGGFSVSPVPPWGGTETGGEGEEGAAGGATQAGEREIVQEPGTR